MYRTTWVGGNTNGMEPVRSVQPWRPAENACHIRLNPTDRQQQFARPEESSPERDKRHRGDRAVERLIHGVKTAGTGLVRAVRRYQGEKVRRGPNAEPGRGCALDVPP